MMGSLKTLCIRLVVSVVFSFIACRIFWSTSEPVKVGGLALLMLGLAYVFEWARRRHGG